MIERSTGSAAAPGKAPRGEPYPPAQYRAAIMQMEAVHEECLPALVHLLRVNGVEPTIFLNERIKTLRPGLRARFPELGENVRFVPIDARADWTRLARRVGRLDPDVVVFNTFQNPGPVSWAAEWAPQWDRPLLGVVHNIDLLQQTEAARDLVAGGQAGLLTLARHVTASLIGRDPLLYARTATITSTFPTPPQVRPETSQRRTVAIPGGVNFVSRDYRQVVDALPAVLSQIEPESFRLVVVGGGADRPALQELVAERGFDEQFEFVPLNEQGYVSGRDYYAHIRGAAFVLPLVPPDARSFRTRKITSAIPTATGLAVPPIIDRWTATVYDVPAVTYTGAEIGGALISALAMSDDEHADLRRRLEDARSRELSRAEREVGYALAAVGVGS